MTVLIAHHDDITTDVHVYVLVACHDDIAILTSRLYLLCTMMTSLLTYKSLLHIMMTSLLTYTTVLTVHHDDITTDVYVIMMAYTTVRTVHHDDIATDIQGCTCCTS